MNIKFSALLFLAIGLLMFSCSKENEVTPTEPEPMEETKTQKEEREEILLSGTWAITEFHYELVRDGENPTTTTAEDVGECYMNNTFNFEENGDFRMDEGLSKCYSHLPQNAVGEWSIRNEGKEFSVDLVPLNSLLLDSRYTFLSFDENSFQIETDYTFSGGVGHQTLTFTAL